MTCSDVQRWLETLEANTNIKHVTIHVGVNDCPGGSIKEETWNGIISSVLCVFPEATLHMSSIIPAKGYNNLNNTIFPSNRSLSNTCHRLCIHFINNFSSFRSPSGRTMYSDHIHPNKNGTTQLAINLSLTFEPSKCLPDNGDFSNKSSKSGNPRDLHCDHMQQPSKRSMSFRPQKMYQSDTNPIHQGGPSTRSRSVLPNGPSFRPNSYRPSYQEHRFHAFPHHQDRNRMTFQPHLSQPHIYDFPHAAAENQQYQYTERVFDNLHSTPHNYNSAYQNVTPHPFPRKPVSLLSPSFPLHTDCFPPLRPHPRVRSLVS
jgi:hypothetical protein